MGISTTIIPQKIDVDNVTIDYNASSQLEVKDGGISTTKLAFGTFERLGLLSLDGLTQADFTGLNGNSDYVYYFWCYCTGGTVKLRFNSYSGTAYAYWSSYNGSYTSGVDGIVLNYGGGPSVIEGYIYVNDSYVSVSVVYTKSIGSSSLEAHQTAGTLLKSNAGSNITSLNFLFSSTQSDKGFIALYRVKY